MRNSECNIIIIMGKHDKKVMVLGSWLENLATVVPGHVLTSRKGDLKVFTLETFLSLAPDYLFPKRVQWTGIGYACQVLHPETIIVVYACGIIMCFISDSDIRHLSCSWSIGLAMAQQSLPRKCLLRVLHLSHSGEEPSVSEELDTFSSFVPFLPEIIFLSDYY